MTRPSGMCEEQPCYTSGDIAEIDAELAVANAELIDLEAQLQVAQDNVDAKQQEVMNLETEQTTAAANQCP